MNSRRSAFFLAIGAGIMWSLQSFFVRRLNGFGIFDLQISMARFIITIVLLAIMMLMRSPSRFRIHLRDLPLFIVAGAVGMVLMTYLYYKTIELATVSFAVGLAYTAPAFVLILSLPVFHEKITARKVISLLLTLFGCLSLSGIMSGGSSQVAPIVVIMGLGGGFAYAMSSVITRFILNRGYRTLTVTFYSYLCATVCCTFLCDFGQLGGAITEHPVSLWYILGMAIVCTIVPAMLYNMSLKRLQASLASMLVSVELVSACILGYFVFGEVLTAADLIGVCCILSAVLLLGVFGMSEERSKLTSLVRRQVLAVAHKAAGAVDLMDAASALDRSEEVGATGEDASEFTTRSRTIP